MKLFKCIPKFSYGNGTPFIVEGNEEDTVKTVKDFAGSIANEDCGFSEHYRGVTVLDISVDSPEAQEWLRSQIHAAELHIEDLTEAITNHKKYLTK